MPLGCEVRREVVAVGEEVHPEDALSDEADLVAPIAFSDQGLSSGQRPGMEMQSESVALVTRQVNGLLDVVEECFPGIVL